MGIDGTSGRRNATLAARLLLLALALVLVALLAPATAAALSVGPQYGTGSATPVTGGWINPEDIAADDGDLAALGFAYPPSCLLRAEGFDFSAIPDDARIDGITVEVERAVWKADPDDPFPTVQDAVWLMDDAECVTSRDSPGSWPLMPSFDTATYGGPTDTWNLQWTPAMLKSPGFAVALYIRRYNVPPIITYENGETQVRYPLVLACVDFIRVTVDYSLPLTITARDQTKDYGDVYDFTGTEFTTSGLQPGDSVSSVDFACTGAAASAEVAGSPYSITPSGAVGSGLDDYAITYVPGEMTVTRRDLTITAADQTKPFGQAFSFTGGEFTAAGLVAGDSVTSATLASVGAAAASPSGTYPVTVSDAVGTHLDDYAITYVPGTLTVGPSHSVRPFAKPLRRRDRRAFERGAVIRLSFRIVDQAGRGVTTLTPQLTVRKGARVKLGPTTVSYSPTKGAYVYSLKTKGWPGARYTASVTLPTAPAGRSVKFTLTR